MNVGKNKKFLIFSLDQELLSTPLSLVKEVIALPKITLTPNTPDYFIG